jgi:hypothetical protein
MDSPHIYGGVSLIMVSPGAPQEHRHGHGVSPADNPDLWRAGRELSPSASHGGSLSSGWVVARGGQIPLIWTRSRLVVAGFVRPIGHLGPEIQFLFVTRPQRNASKNGAPEK